MFEMFADTVVPGKKLSALNTYVFGTGTPEYSPVSVMPSLMDPVNKTVSVYEKAMGVAFDKEPATDRRIATKVPDPIALCAPCDVPLQETPMEQLESAG